MLLKCYITEARIGSLRPRAGVAASASEAAGGEFERGVVELRASRARRAIPNAMVLHHPLETGPQPGWVNQALDGAPQKTFPSLASGS